jgi:hypothetical protein
MELYGVGDAQEFWTAIARHANDSEWRDRALSDTMVGQEW